MSETTNNLEGVATASTVALLSTGSWLDVVQERVNGLRYGVIQIVVHDGRVTQVECTEKMRFESERARDAGAAAPAPRRTGRTP